MKNLKKAKELLEVQGQSGNWDYLDYIYRIYNNMELINAVLEHREPKYKSQKDVRV